MIITGPHTSKPSPNGIIATAISTTAMVAKMSRVSQLRTAAASERFTASNGAIWCTDTSAGAHAIVNARGMVRPNSSTTQTAMIPIIAGVIVNWSPPHEAARTKGSMAASPPPPTTTMTSRTPIR
jgi:hypothetical protein